MMGWTFHSGSDILVKSAEQTRAVEFFDKVDIMTTKAFLTIAWELGKTEISGPYDTREIAQDIMACDYLGTSMQVGILGPFPFEQLIADGKWIEGESKDKSQARMWAVFETADVNVQWLAFGDNPEGFDHQTGEPGKMVWVGNYEGETPADAYREANESHCASFGTRYVAIPVGVFGPTDWMRVAGDMLTKIKD